MTLLQAFLLGLVQGITEFLPISSDGHLVLLESWLKLPVADLKAFDVALHLGTLIAMFIYFWKDLIDVLKDRRMMGLIIVGTLPAVIVGFTLEDWIDRVFRKEGMVFAMLAVMGLFYLIAEKFSKAQSESLPEKKLTFANVLLIGVAQAFALIQGISRSGSTIGSGLLCGLTRERAARFSFVLGTPVIAGAVLLKSLDIVQGEATLPAWDATLMGLVTSLIAGYASIAFLMKFLKNHRLTVFSVYLFILAAVGGLSLAN